MPVNDTFPLEIGDYGFQRSPLPTVVISEADSGRRAVRLKRAPRLLHRITMKNRPTSDRLLLEQFYRQFERGWFSLHDPIAIKTTDDMLERFYSVEFQMPPQYQIDGFETWQISCELVDKVGVALFQYPDPDAGHPSTFLEEDSDLLTVVAGTWTAAAQALAHAESERTNVNTNTTDAVTWSYGGYGFRVWSRTGPGLGKLGLYLDGALLTTLDLYAAADTAAQAVFTKLDVPLGLHVVQLSATNTKNASATGQVIVADALEVMI
jgi:hypothetical protein